jgi:hypothetical protein
METDFKATTFLNCSIIVKKENSFKWIKQKNFVNVHNVPYILSQIKIYYKYTL